MKGLREPLLWIALASFVAFLPFSTVRVPTCLAIALSLRMLMGTRVARQAAVPLLVAFFSSTLACFLHAALLTTQMLRTSTLHLAYPAAEWAVSITLIALATALGRIADAAAIEESHLWFSAIRVLFLGAMAIDIFIPGVCTLINLLACPFFAVLVFRMRSAIPRTSAR